MSRKTQPVTHQFPFNLRTNDPTLNELMSIIIYVLQISIYVRPHLFTPFEEVLRNITNPEIFKIKDSCLEGTTPYYNLCIELMKELSTKSSEIDSIHHKYKDQIKGIVFISC